ncbi:Hypothetical protein CGLY_10625 [Corynebacterium glyciniphilum AJ 3170]|uniref:Uncharacterized protein n=1 Tax=Corynebacterium glyciniphilum AJ 3170 TaxID=1404245 RepID=X5EAX7_9CORY|nr:helix-turn-helix domain-containing protein [Corynebacterium glyciniphilum]AHW64570.1 Hypothetical protein CGLY_10625 [Corynebacterium glyciniphilum AJ 3170]
MDVFDLDREHSRDRWRSLLEELAELEEQLSVEFMEQIQRGARYYDGIPELQDLWDNAVLAFRYLITALLDRPMSEDLASFPAGVGARRARQRISLENVSSAVRTDFPIIWSVLLRCARDRGDLVVLALHTEELWSVVDRFVVAIQRGYLDESLIMARSDVIEQQRSLATIFTDTTATSADLEHAALVLGIDNDATFWVLGTADEDDMGTVAERLERRSISVVEHARYGGGLLLAGTGPWLDDDALATDVLDGIPGAAHPRPVTLSGVVAATATVQMLVSLGQEAATLRRSWAGLSIRQLATVEADLRDVVLGPLEGVPDRDTIVKTVLAYANTGSFAATSAALYCHRNTVLNRVRKFEEVTKIDLRHPRSLALVQLCLLPPG